MLCLSDFELYSRWVPLIVVQRRQRNVQKKSCTYEVVIFPVSTYCFFAVLVAVAVVVTYDRELEIRGRGRQRKRR